MDKNTKGVLKSVVTQCRKLLEDSTREQLEGVYGIRVGHDGNIIVEPLETLNHLADDEKMYREHIEIHLGHIQSGGFKPKDAYDQLVREIAFTHLNRICAFKMMERRGLMREAVSRGVDSQGLKFYLADHPEDEKAWISGKQDIAYHHFLEFLAKIYSNEIKPLFSENDPANRLFPPHRVIEVLLSLVNCPGLQTIWSEDEAIGWIYQYFTPKELRDKSRKESEVPRNSYELAFRNQFYTPRYVVGFLVDNTLGRIWYEMMKGKTSLREKCGYLVIRPNELFLDAGVMSPNQPNVEKSKSELLGRQFSVSHRSKKDPRTIRVLDPAGGSGHFMIYSYDLFETIYLEAYQDDELGPALKADYPSIDEYKIAIPGLILRHNLHCIDIDQRACQMAALALWLRAQRSYQELNIRSQDRPKIEKANIVSAEPMPGEGDLLEDFINELQPKLLGQLVKFIFDKLKLAGEAGSLLRIEEDLRKAIQDAKQQWQEEFDRATDKKGNELLFSKAELIRATKGSINVQEGFFDVSGIGDSDFWTKAEELTLVALRQFASQLTNGQGYKRKLFAEDALLGFSFVDICLNQYDVVLMNPPFGKSSATIRSYIDRFYPHWNDNLLCAFIQRGWQLTLPDGMVGAIYDRTAIVKSTYEQFRSHHLIPNHRMTVMADLGWYVLDANVEVTTTVLSHHSVAAPSLFFDLREIDSEKKGPILEKDIKSVQSNECTLNTYVVDTNTFDSLPNCVIGYDFPEFLTRAFTNGLSIEKAGYQAYQGHALKSDRHFRLWWECADQRKKGYSARLFNGAGFSPYSTPLRDVVIAESPLESLKKDSATVLRNKEKHLLPGICFGKRGDYFCAHILPTGHIFTVEGQSIPVKDSGSALELVALLNTPLARYSLNRYCGQHKYSGYVNMLPYKTFTNVNAIVAEVVKSIKANIQCGRLDETQSQFDILFAGDSLTAYAKTIEDAIRLGRQLSTESETLAHLSSFEAYNVSEAEQQILEIFRNSQPGIESPYEDADLDNNCKWIAAHSLVSHAVGVAFGRWNIQYVPSEQLNLTQDDLFKPLPPVPPVALKRSDDDPSSYPVATSKDGIMVEDSDNDNDIVRMTESISGHMCKKKADSILLDACIELNVDGLRSYFRKTSKHGFWQDHISRYSKSRRKAPIYWLLQTPSQGYSIWVYYPRLTKDTYFKILSLFVEPKIRLESDRIEKLRNERIAAGITGREAKQLEKAVQNQDAFVTELLEFRDRIRKVADLNLEPDLNDGVLLNLAPLHELVPWAEPTKCWEELLAGEYQWSSVSRQLKSCSVIK